MTPLERVEDQMRRDWPRMQFCRKNGWYWYWRYRNRLWAAIALRRAYRSSPRYPGLR